jgi:nitrate/TMAO reductase-like tetraheme cytochrome c subunit
MKRHAAAERGAVRRPFRILLVGLVAVGLGMTVLFLAAPDAAAEEDPQRWNNEFCLGCHRAEGRQPTVPSGETLSLTFDEEEFAGSIHGSLEMPCVLCHTNIEGFPHPEITATSLRDWTLQRNEGCTGCHQDEFTDTRDNVHAAALEAGNTAAAVCTDCHSGHGATRPVAHSPEVPLTCRACHSQIYDLYQDSVHGAALINGGNRDVPTCTDCHGVHDVEGPTDSPFHLFSPQICAECHADDEMMNEYGISTDVFETYVADFHGTTVILFEDLAPDQETNKPVCIDCHGVHGIRSEDDPESGVFLANLLRTCQRCHPDATENFPTSWLSHYKPEPGIASVVWLVDLFYKIFIPLVIGGMLFYIALHLIGWVRRRGARRYV